MADAQLKAVITAEDRASRVIAGVGKSLDDTKSKLAGALDFTKKLAPAFAVLGVAAGGLAVKGILVAGQLESMRQGFVTLLGSAEAADKTMARIKQEAARTPFELPGLTSATQALALVTKDGDKAIDVLMNVGKALATAGKGQVELDRIIANLQQIALTGQITEMDIRQFGMSGVNILELLAKHYGTTTKEASEMVKNSKDAFGDLTAAFEKAGAEGGQFAKGFENQAGTFQVVWSNLMDTINVKLAEFVTRTGIFDVVKKSIQKVVDILPALVEWLIRASEAVKSFYEQAKKLYSENTINEKLKELGQAIKNLLPELSELLQDLKPLVPILLLIGRYLYEKVVAGLNAMIESATKVVRAVTLIVHWLNVFDKWMESKSGWGVRFGESVKEAFNKSLESVKNWVSETVSSVEKTYKQIIDTASRNAVEIKNKIASAMNVDWGVFGKQALEGFKSAYLGLWSYVIDSWSEWFKIVAEFFAKSYAQTAEGLKLWAEEFSKSMVSIKDNLTDWFSRTTEQIGSWFKSIPEKLTEWFIGWKEKISAFFVEGYENISTGLQNWLDNLQSWFSELPARFTQWFEKVTESVKNWFSTLFEREDVAASIDKTTTDMITRLSEAFDKNKMVLIGKWALIIITVIASLPLLIAAAIITFAIDVTLKMVKAISDNAPKIKDAIMNAFKDAFFAVIDSIGDWISQITGKINSGLSQVKSGASNLVNKLNPFRAGGGSVDPSRSFIVGERGPELFTPSTYGSITSNNKLGNGGGITINVYGDVSGEALVEKVKSSLMREIKQNAFV